MKKMIATLATLMVVSIVSASDSEPGRAPGNSGMAPGAPAVPEGNQEEPKAKSEIHASVTVKNRDYLLTRELKDGKAAIKEALAKQSAPSVKPPAVDLELVLKNNSRQPAVIIWGGDQSRISMSLKGPGAINGTWPMMMTMDFQMGTEIKLAPGAVHRVPIKSLGFGPRNIIDSGCWWTAPGDYQLAVSGSFAQGEQQATFAAPPVTLHVSEGGGISP
jgi:hypothetical protein